MEPQKPENFQKLKPEVVKRGVAKERVAKRVRSCTVHNETRDGLERMTEDAGPKLSIVLIPER